MGKSFMKDGTPVGSSSLCRTCTRGLVMRGFRESEQVTICDWVSPNLPVPFPVYDCTGFYDKNRPSWKQMEDLAIDVVPGPLKPVGFKTGIIPPVKITVGTPNTDDDE